MSKQVMQMQMDVLKNTFTGVSDVLVLTISGLSCQADNALRLGLRKKKIRMQMVKNTLTRRIFNDMGIRANCWEGNTVVAWGGDSLSELCKEVETLIKKNDKIKVKTAISDKKELAYEQAKKLPTKPEALGRIVGLALAPASRLMSQILGPASRVVGQVKSLKDKAPEEKAEEKPADTPIEVTASTAAASADKPVEAAAPAAAAPADKPVEAAAPAAAEEKPAT